MPPYVLYIACQKENLDNKDGQIQQEITRYNMACR